MLSTTSALHYELAIPLPRISRDAGLLAWLGFLIVTGFGLLLLLVVTPHDGWFLHILGADELGSARYMLPVSLMLNGFGTVLTMETVRKQEYLRNSIAKALQGSLQSIAQASAALFGLGWSSLILGQLFGSFAGLCPFLHARGGQVNHFFSKLTIKRISVLARKYRGFPLASTPASFINAAAANIPTLMLAGLFSAEVAGWYGLGFRMLQLPARFFGQALSQVFLGKAAQAARDNQLSQFVAPAFRTLLSLSLYTFIPLAMLAPAASGLVFGVKWIEAGRYIQYLTPWLLMGFVSTPLSMLVSVLQKQRQELWLQSGYLLLVVIALGLGALVGSVTVGLLSLGCVGSVYLAAKLWWLLGLSGCERHSTLWFAVREMLLSLLVYLPVLITLKWYTPAAWFCVLGGAWVVLIHIVNFRFRDIYEFK